MVKAAKLKDCDECAAPCAEAETDTNTCKSLISHSRRHVSCSQKRRAAKALNPFEMAKKASSSSSPKEESLLWPSTTALSPHLKFGTVSVRQFYFELQDILKNELKGKHTNPPTSLMGQILWREFYYVNACGTLNYDKMVGNRICKQIKWKHDPENLAKGKTRKPGSLGSMLR